MEKCRETHCQALKVCGTDRPVEAKLSYPAPYDTAATCGYLRHGQSD